jgi:hypothetical protein
MQTSCQVALNIRSIHQCAVNLCIAIFLARLPLYVQGFGELEIRGAGDASIVTDLIGVVLAAMVWLFAWRLLNRLNKKPTFCYWFPSTMTVVIALLGWGLSIVDSSTRLGTVVGSVFVIVACINFPVLIVIGVFGELGAEYLPTWSMLPFAGTIFRLSWHLILRFLRNRALHNLPITLNINQKASSSSEMDRSEAQRSE